MPNRIFGNHSEKENQMPPFEQYQGFVDRAREMIHASRVANFYFWVGVIAFWILVCVGFAFATRYFITTLSFVPQNINISVIDILKIYGILALLVLLKKLFPVE